jgi:hypothetical protein
MAQLGHTDPAFTLRVYAHAMRRGEGDKEALKALVEGRHWAPLGTSGADGRGGFRTCDLSRVKRDEMDCGQPPDQDRLF